MKIFRILLLFGFCVLSLSAQSAHYDGIDISRHNGNISWEKVAKDKNIKFVYIKASEGKTYTDPKYYVNFRNARKSGLRVGSYHYFRMTSGAHEQFLHFKNAVNKDKQDLIPMIDVETTDKHSVSETRDSLRVFLQLVEKYYGIKPMIYGTNRSYNTICGTWFNRYKLYLGRYGQKPPVIKGREHYLIWQYSEKGNVCGIPKTVDLCRFHNGHSIKDILYKTAKKKMVGIDLSHHNHVDDWTKVNVDFIYLKATEGVGWKDPKFADFMRSARRRNIPVGAYHFMTTASSAAEQFNYFKSVVPKDNIDLVPVLDIERCTKGHPMSRTALQRHVQKWCELCKKHYGVNPMLYCSRAFYLKNFKGQFDYLQYWCGDVDATRSYVDKLHWTLWQQRIDAVPGIKGKVDIDILNADFNLQKITMKKR